jgi:hypothetical protein
VMSVPIAGGAPIPLASGQNSPRGIAVDATSLYWTNEGTGKDGYMDGAIVKLPVTGGTTTTLASAQHSPSQITVDATSVYWTNNGTAANDGAVMKIVKQ